MIQWRAIRAIRVASDRAPLTCARHIAATARPRNPAHFPIKNRHASAVLLLPALLWIFTQLVMSGFILQPSVAQAGGLHVITICSGTKLTTLTVDANGKPVKDIPAKKVSCPWCAQFGGMGPVPAPDLAQVAAPSSDGHRIAVPQGHLTTSLSFTHYASRAPPLSTSL